MWRLAIRGRRRRGSRRAHTRWGLAIDRRNARSLACLGLHISYPKAEERAAAEARGVDPRGAMMIRGLLNGRGAPGRLHRRWGWANSCNAVTNAEMREIRALVLDGTPITIR